MLICKKRVVCLICLLLHSSIIFADEPSIKRTSYFNEKWMKTVVSIEMVEKSGSARPIGTGFLVDSPNKHILLVTAKHVILDNEGNIINNYAVRLNNKSGKSLLLTDEMFEKRGFGQWFLSKDSDVACKFIYRKETSDVLFIPISEFLSSEELNVGAPLIILGFPMGLRSEEFAVPIARIAMVAKNDSKNIIVDGFVFPGNSGGPVVYCPVIKLGTLFKSAVINKQQLIGLVSQSINYVDTAVSLQTKRPRVTFEDNSGLSNVIPADAILELINREDVQTFDKKF